MFTSTIRTEDQESNLTARQLSRVHIKLYISFDKRHRLANEGLLNLTGDTGRELGLPASCARFYPLLYDAGP